MLPISKIKSRTYTYPQVNLNFSSNVVGDSNNESNFPQKLLLTNALVSGLFKVFANNLLANVNLSKT